jgi:hypothetical protein
MESRKEAKTEQKGRRVTIVHKPESTEMQSAPAADDAKRFELIETA